MNRVSILDKFDLKEGCLPQKQKLLNLEGESIFEKILLSLKKKSSDLELKGKDGDFSKSKDSLNDLKELLNSSEVDVSIEDIETQMLDGDTLDEIDELKNIYFKEEIDGKEKGSVKGIENKKIVFKDEKAIFLQKNSLSRLVLHKRVKQEAAVNEIKEIKSIDDILKISKKFKLNIKSINVEKEDQSKKGDSEIKSDLKTVKVEPKQMKATEIKEQILQSKPVLLSAKIEQNIKGSVGLANKKRAKDDFSLKELLQKGLSDKEKSIAKDSKERMVLEPGSAATKKVDTNINSSVKIESNMKPTDEKYEAENSLERLDEKSLRSVEVEKRVVEVKKSKENKKENIEEFVDSSKERAETKRAVELDSSVNKSEIVRQKVINAKQMVLSFAKTLQEQVENYKPPFTRMQLSLDPEDLGKVDLTLISRGKNLHIQVNSNPVAIGAMAIQSNELRNQLTSMGFTDVQMQFNMNQQQQQQQQEKRKLYSSKEYLEIDEIPEIDSLEIIIPQYV